MDFNWTKKDLLSLYDLSAEEILCILDTAAEFKKVSQRKIKKVPALRGKTVVNLFVEPSTRTRTSFELAEQRRVELALQRILEVNDLKEYFPIKTGLFGITQLKAVDGVSFNIRPGETLGLVGES